MEPADDLRRGEDEARAHLTNGPASTPALFFLKTKLLFVCSRNQWRSPTAEAPFKEHPLYEARSAATENGARVKLTTGHIGWADRVFCMEKGHAARVREKFAAELGDKPLIVLRIPDDYEFMDPVLTDLLRSGLSGHVEF